MPWTERRLTPSFGVELSGQRIGPTLSAEDHHGIDDATARCGVTLIRDQHLSDADIYGFACMLGDRVVELPALDGWPAHARGVMPLSNVDREGGLLPADDWNVKQNLANELWHTDMTFMRPRATLSLLYGVTVPPQGGDTEFCDTRLFWEQLSRKERLVLKRLTCWHSVIHSRKKYGFDDWSQEAIDRYPAVQRPVAEVQISTGRTALSIGAYVELVDGMSPSESQALIADLVERATVAENVYRHRWNRGDLLLWDNRCMMHRARPFAQAEHARDLRALRLYDSTFA